MPRNKPPSSRTARGASAPNGHVTLTDEAYAALEELIVHGTLAAGGVVTEAMLESRESPAELKATTRYVYSVPASRPVSEKLFTPAPPVPTRPPLPPQALH